MNQIIVKRPANVSSQEALAQLATEYADAEVLSFRRVKAANFQGEYYVATLRTALVADEPNDVVLDDSDVVLEGRGHEEEEEEQMEDQDDKLDKIIDLIEKLIEKEEHEAPEPSLLQQRPPVKNPMPMQASRERLARLRKRLADNYEERLTDNGVPWSKARGQTYATCPVRDPEGNRGAGTPLCEKGKCKQCDAERAKEGSKKCQCWDGYKRVPGTKPCEPGSCEKCDSARKKSMVVVERDANVSASRAKLELLKEFGKEYKIARIAKTGKVYSATLVKRAETHAESSKTRTRRRNSPTKDYSIKYELEKNKRKNDFEYDCANCKDEGCKECDVKLTDQWAEDRTGKVVKRATQFQWEVAEWSNPEKGSEAYNAYVGGDIEVLLEVQHLPATKWQPEPTWFWSIRDYNSEDPMLTGDSAETLEEAKRAAESSFESLKQKGEFQPARSPEDY